MVHICEQFAVEVGNKRNLTCEEYQRTHSNGSQKVYRTLFVVTVLRGNLEEYL